MEDRLPELYDIVARIPKGMVTTYGQIAIMLGDPQGARAVGRAMQRVPCHLDLPCHRVVNKAGAMAPDFVFGGADKQRAILEREGVTFTADGCIDMKRHLWLP